MTIQRDRLGHHCRSFCSEAARIDIRVRRDRSNSEKEGPVAIKAIVQKPQRLLGDDVDGVVSLVADGGVAIALVCTI